jgi:hypothetical protein
VARGGEGAAPHAVVGEKGEREMGAVVLLLDQQSKNNDSSETRSSLPGGEDEKAKIYLMRLRDMREDRDRERREERDEDLHTRSPCKLA